MTRSSLFPQKRRRAWPLSLLYIVVIVLSAAVLAGWLTLRGSLPQLDGTHAAPLTATVTIARDALGVPTVQGRTRDDVAYANGFIHAQDRFFQMDLLRRVAAGEMAALIGPAALALDRRRSHWTGATGPCVFANTRRRRSPRCLRTSGKSSNAIRQVSMTVCARFARGRSNTGCCARNRLRGARRTPCSLSTRCTSTFNTTR